MAAFSTATALVTKDISSFAAVINGMNLPILLLAGVLLPISLGPIWMRVLAHFNPLYYLVQASRALAVGSFGSPAVWQAFAVLVPLCALVVTLGDAGVPKGGRLTSRRSGQSLPIMTSVALMTALTESPSASARLSAESFVIAATTSWPPARRTTTVDMTAPWSTRTTTPSSWFLALSLMSAG